MKTRPSATGPWAIAAVALISLCLTGCASLRASAVAAAVDRALPGQPTVNSYVYSHLPVGPWIALSLWRIQGPLASTGQAAVAKVRLDGIGEIEIVSPTHAVDSIRERLGAALEGCAPLQTQLISGAVQVAAVMDFLARDRVALPQVRLLLVPPGEGHAGLDIAMASTMAGLRLTTAAQLPESRTCLWAQHWMTETLDTLVHELFHAWRFAQIGPPADRLREEFVAYAVGECVARAAAGGVPRQRRFPGLETYATADIIAAARRGEIPATIAGRFLAYRLGPARPDQAPEDAWRLGCTRLPYAYPGLNSEAP